MNNQIACPEFQSNEECAQALFNYLCKTGAIEGSNDDRIDILHDINNLRGHEWLPMVERNLTTKPFFDYIGGAEFFEDEFIYGRGIAPAVFLNAVFDKEFPEDVSFSEMRDLLDENGFQDLWDYPVEDLDEAINNLSDDMWLLAVSFYEDNGYFARVFEVTDEIAKRFERMLISTELGDFVLPSDVRWIRHDKPITETDLDNKIGQAENLKKHNNAYTSQINVSEPTR